MLKIFSHKKNNYSIYADCESIKEKLFETMQNTINLSYEVSNKIKEKEDITFDFSPRKPISEYDFDIFNNSIIVIDEEGRIVNLNSATAKLFSWKKEELMFKDISYLFFFKKNNEITKFIEIMKTNKCDSIINCSEIGVKGISKNKKLFNMNISSNLMYEDNNLYLILIIYNTIKNKNENKDKKCLLKNNDNGVVILKKDIIINSNEKFKKIFGCNIGKSFTENISEEYIDVLTQTYEIDEINSEKCFYLKCLDKDKNELNLKANIKTIVDDLCGVLSLIELVEH